MEHFWRCFFYEFECHISESVQIWKCKYIFCKDSAVCVNVFGNHRSSIKYRLRIRMVLSTTPHENDFFSQFCGLHRKGSAGSTECSQVFWQCEGFRCINYGLRKLTFMNIFLLDWSRQLRCCAQFRWYVVSFGSGNQNLPEMMHPNIIMQKVEFL